MALFDAIHSVDRPKLAETIARLADETGRRPDLFVQVNTGAEPQKAGVALAEAPALVERCRALDLPVRGLMCIPPEADDPAPHFQTLAGLAARSWAGRPVDGDERRLRGRDRGRRHPCPRRVGDLRRAGDLAHDQYRAGTSPPGDPAQRVPRQSDAARGRPAGTPPLVDEDRRAARRRAPPASSSRSAGSGHSADRAAAAARARRRAGRGPGGCSRDRRDRPTTDRRGRWAPPTAPGGRSGPGGRANRRSGAGRAASRRRPRA